jgi:hypothetical protein
LAQLLTLGFRVLRLRLNECANLLLLGVGEIDFGKRALSADFGAPALTSSG